MSRYYLILGTAPSMYEKADSKKRIKNKEKKQEKTRRSSKQRFKDTMRER